MVGTSNEGQVVAHIDDLLQRLPDDALRQEISNELGRLRSRVNFGLNFERHAPETVALPGLPIRAGATVVPRTRPDDHGTYTVLAVDGPEVKVVARDDAEDQRTFGLDDVALVRDFGEPIYPALELVERVQHDEAQGAHAVVAGENFHALQMFTYMWEGQFDVIYIDPPYNTGARDWRYNNDYVDNQDDWRHSKWLSFMEKRLRLAKRLLRPDGVLIVTIDEHEQVHLGMLLESERLFRDFDRTMITIVINPKGSPRANFARVEEYAYFCVAPAAAPLPGLTEDQLGTHDADIWVEDDADDSPDAMAAAPGGATPKKVRLKGALRSGPESLREDRPSMFYPIFVEPGTRTALDVGEPLPMPQQPDFEPRADGAAPAWPINEHGEQARWTVGAETMRAKIAAGEVRVGRFDSSRRTYPISYLPDSAKGLDVEVVPRKRVKTVWRQRLHDAGAYGTDLIKTFIGKPNTFTFPKSLYAVRDCLAAAVGDRPDALVLDFFAGSGTTLHATMLLNAEDGGRRRCVVVTNNEVDVNTAQGLNGEGLFPGDPDFEAHGIFEQVTWPRCFAAVTGARKDCSVVEGQYADGRAYGQGFPESVDFTE